MSGSTSAPESLQDLYDDAPWGFFSSTMDGVVVNVNATLLRWLGLERTQVLETPFQEWLQPPDKAEDETSPILAIRFGEEIREVTLTLARADGDQLPVVVSAVVRSGPDGERRIRAAVRKAAQFDDLQDALRQSRRVAEAAQEHARLLLDASSTFADATTVDDVAAGLADIGRHASGAATSVVMLLNAEGEFVVAAGSCPWISTPNPPGPTPEADAARRGRTVTVSDLNDAEANYPHLSTRMQAHNLAALIATPVFTGQKIAGVLMCLFREGQVFDVPTIDLQRALARPAAQVMLRIQLEDERRRHHDISESLLRAGREVSARLRATDSPRVMLKAVAQKVGGVLGAQSVRILVSAQPELPLLEEYWTGDPLGDDRSYYDGEPRLLDTSLGVDRTSLPVRESDSAIVVPLGGPDKAIGLIAVEGEQKARSFTAGERAFVQCVATDLTHNLLLASLRLALAKTVEQSAQLARERVEMMADFNHELRTPLTVIIGYADLLAERTRGHSQPGVEAMVAAVQSSAERLHSILDNMMAAARDADSDRSVEVDLVDVGETIASVVRALSPVSDGNGVTFSIDVPRQLVVRGDRHGLEQVLAHVLSNAVKFSISGGVVSVVARRGSPRERCPVTITIVDTGIGIPACELPRIGTLLFRASNARTAAVPGLGLGLFIAQGFLNAAGGSLTVASEIAAGTTVEVTLP